MKKWLIVALGASVVGVAYVVTRQRPPSRSNAEILWSEIQSGDWSSLFRGGVSGASQDATQAVNLWSDLSNRFQ